VRRWASRAAGIGRRWAVLGGGRASAALGDDGRVGGGRALGGVGWQRACGRPALSGVAGVWRRWRRWAALDGGRAGAALDGGGRVGGSGRRLACDSNRAIGGRFRGLYFRRPG
jgi:hypothetical protein